MLSSHQWRCLEKAYRETVDKDSLHTECNKSSFPISASYYKKTYRYYITQ